MTNYRKLVPPYLQTVGSYKPGKPLRHAELETGVSCIKMASNENAFGPSPLAIAAMKAAISDIHYYPDNDVTELRARLSELHEIEPEQILVSSGSTSLLDIIARTLLAPGLNAITSKLSFIVYPIVTHATGARLIEVPTLQDGFDLEAILAAIDDNTRLLYIANPNNPTGTVIEANVLDKFLQRLPSHVITVLDEAYCDYATCFADQRNVDYSHSLEYVGAERPVIVLRTFSKAHGLAGLRVGYAMGPAELLSYINRLKMPFTITSVGEAAALAALADYDHIRMSVESNAREAQRMMQALAGMGLQTVPTWANFLFCRLGQNVAPFCQLLQEEGIIVRPMTAWGAPDAFRVTVGTPDHNEQFLTAVEKALEHVNV